MLRVFRLSLVFMAIILPGLAACSGEEAPECSNDAQCPNGRYCLKGKCIFDCTYDSQCPEGFHCTTRGKCERGCAKTNGGVEACDGVDNDCDGSTDEDFPDLGQECSNGQCPAGIFICSDDGTHVLCNGMMPSEDDSTCDNMDDDCDGQTDEDAQQRPCPLTQGVCEGSVQTCKNGQWTECDYGPSYRKDKDEKCDQQDEDCDGLTDEDAHVVPIGESGDHANDGVDNNCSGVVDEPGGIMVKAQMHDGTYFAIDAYETTVFENPDCTGTRFGEHQDDYPAGFPGQGTHTVELYACSLPGIIPSGFMSWYRAQWACEAQGKRLCTAEEFQAACSGAALTAYPYGTNFIPGICNEGWLEPSEVAPTGSYESCVNDYGCYDMSGNLNEWLVNDGKFGPISAQVGGGSYACLICDDGLDCTTCPRGLDPFFIDRSTNCNPNIVKDFENYRKDLTSADLGTRCCMDLQ